MKKFFLSCMMALVAMCGLNSCSEDCDHDFIEHDYSQALVGTWTCIENDYAEALVIKADGSVEVTGVVDDEYFESKGTIKVKNNKMIYKLDNGDEWEGRFEMTTGESFTMVLSEELDIRYTYRYCENDLADEVVGMWVCNDAEEHPMIRTFSEDGKVVFSGFDTLEGDYVLNSEDKYKVIGDLMFISALVNNVPTHIASQILYLPNGTELGDIMTTFVFLPTGDLDENRTSSWLRVKQGLNFTGKAYAYSSAYVTNAKGTDEDFTIMGHTFNMAKIKASDFDVILGANLFCVELNANSITHKYRPNGQDEVFDAPITVEGNKVTLDMSAVNPVLREVVMYMYQDKDDCQLHMYMPTSSFVNYFANLEIVTLLSEGKLDPTDSVAVEKFFADMEARIESINVSFVMKAIEK